MLPSKIDPTISLFDFAQHSVNKPNIVRFSFTVPNEVARDTLYVQAEIEVELVELSRRRRRRTRRMLLNPNPTANQLRLFVEPIGINHGQERPQQYYPPQKPISKPYQPISLPSSFIINSLSPWIIAIGGLLGLILTLNIIFMVYNNYCNNDRISFRRRGRKQRYSKVNIDSELDSEAQMIVNESIASDDQ